MKKMERWNVNINDYELFHIFHFVESFNFLYNPTLVKAAFQLVAETTKRIFNIIEMCENNPCNMKDILIIWMIYFSTENIFFIGKCIQISNKLLDFKNL